MQKIKMFPHLYGFGMNLFALGIAVSRTFALLLTLPFGRKDIL